jgi:hypothetical protein
MQTDTNIDLLSRTGSIHGMQRMSVLNLEAEKRVNIF